MGKERKAYVTEPLWGRLWHPKANKATGRNTPPTVPTLKNQYIAAYMLAEDLNISDDSPFQHCRSRAIEPSNFSSDVSVMSTD
jgi:hypothetical protein